MNINNDSKPGDPTLGADRNRCAEVSFEPAKSNTWTCPRCDDRDVWYVSIQRDNLPPRISSIATLRCNACDYTWEFKGRRTPAIRGAS